MTDIRTSYLGLNLKNPFIASASPLASNLDGIKRIEDSGASALVLFSLMEEQFINDTGNNTGSVKNDTFATRYSEVYPIDFKVSPDEYYELIRKAKESVNIPVIASLNGTEPGEWLKAAESIDEAGADALELNIYSPPIFNDLDPSLIDERYLGFAQIASEYTDIPTSVKLSPNHSNLISLIKKLDKSGIDGFVLFNRNFQPDIDVITMEQVAKPYYSSVNDSILPMRWISLLFGRVLGEMAASGGVISAEDAIKMMLVGADAVMVFSAIMKHGFGIIKEMEDELRKWMLARDFRTIDEFRGTMSTDNIDDPGAYERVQYLRILNNF